MLRESYIPQFFWLSNDNSGLRHRCFDKFLEFGVLGVAPMDGYCYFGLQLGNHLACVCWRCCWRRGSGGHEGQVSFVWLHLDICRVCAVEYPYSACVDVEEVVGSPVDSIDDAYPYSAYAVGFSHFDRDELLARNSILQVRRY